ITRDVSRCRERGNGRRLWLVAGLAAAIALFGAGIALAADTIVGEPTNTYSGGSGGTYHSNQGEVVPFQVNGGTHSVTAHAAGPDGKPLYHSLWITGETTGVSVTQYLTTGTYTFF